MKTSDSIERQEERKAATRSNGKDPTGPFSSKIAFAMSAAKSCLGRPDGLSLWPRVSTKDKGQDVRNQLEELRSYCDKRGWHIANEYIDQKSGKNGDREQFQRVMNHASQREFDLVLFWSLDR